MRVSDASSDDKNHIFCITVCCYLIPRSCAFSRQGPASKKFRPNQRDLRFCQLTGTGWLLYCSFVQGYCTSIHCNVIASLVTFSRIAGAEAWKTSDVGLGIPGGASQFAALATNQTSYNRIDMDGQANVYLLVDANKAFLCQYII